ncbi:hypothetical protein BG015_000575 [Linnemannia schmuckeri]|uniref:F-box domain-containing protein n=1 Tax=Linnemannia schmuckeri TaxID=64567 RepID=A0A9P5RUE5_9FUNG|nr:hypothetical protein BG015_000575 [Linnemannia schmuckeri]
MEGTAHSDTATYSLTTSQHSLPMTLTASSLTSSLSALEIPEIMANVFGWLDDETANRTLILVCRQWYVWNRHRIFRDLYWNSDQTQEDLETSVLSRLVCEPNRLFCHIRVRYGDLDSALDKWRQLVAALAWADPLKRHVRDMEGAPGEDDIRSGGEEKDSRREREVEEDDAVGVVGTSSREGTSKPDDDGNRVLRHLTITGIVQFDSHMWQILSGLSYLTSLTVKVDSCGWVSMHNILNSCRYLEDLHLETTTWVSIPGSNWLVGDEGEGEDEDHHLSSMEGQPAQRRRLQTGPLALRSLVLRNAQFDQRALEAFLPFVPFLYRIQVAVWLPYLSRPSHGDRERLCQLLRTNCPLVRVFHFSYQGLHVIRTAPEDMDPVFDLCPRMTDWMISAVHFTPSLIKRFPQDVLTTLEIIGADCKHLHAYLCTTTHLQHLRAPRTRFPYEHMDIHLRSTEGYPHTGGVRGSGYEGEDQHQSVQDVAATVAKVWACRGLLTLKLAFSHMSNQPQASRIVFGYISRVCPQLQDLEICGPEGVRMDRKIRPTPMCMTLEGGFCLLSRLKRLERLCVGIVMLDLKLKDVDLAWIKGERGGSDGGGGGSEVLLLSGSKVRPRSGSTTSIKSIKKGWSTLLRREKEQELTRVQNFGQWVDSSPGDGGYGGVGKVAKTESGQSDTELEQSLQHLGLLEDVVLLLKEIDTNNNHSNINPGSKCWPNMRRMSIYSGNSLGESLEREYGRLLKASEQNTKEKEKEKGGGGLLAGIRSFVGSLVGMS